MLEDKALECTERNLYFPCERAQKSLNLELWDDDDERSVRNKRENRKWPLTRNL